MGILAHNCTAEVKNIWVPYSIPLYTGLTVLIQEGLEDYVYMTALRISIIVIFLPSLFLKSVTTYDN